MKSKFDELTKSLAQSVTRRAALKKFSFGLVGLALAWVGLANKAEAGQGCTAHVNCPPDNPHCCNLKKCTTYTCPTDPLWSVDASYCAAYCPPKGIH